MNKLEIFLKNTYNIDEDIISLSKKVEQDIKSEFDKIEEIAAINQYKVLHAMQKNKLSDIHFHGTTGYGYNDLGRDVIDKIYADIFKTEDALVRYNFISGTHALATVLYGLLRPNDTLLAVTGKPYDTLDEIIGIRGEGNGSLKDFGVNYKQVDLLKDGSCDFEKIKEALKDESIKVIEIQRSKGYSFRSSLTIDDLEKLITFIKNIRKDVICFVDNCYGEFVEDKEPTEVGADVCVGSLIKNTGGGIAHTGGYIVGRKELIEKISYRLTCPGIGKECGPTLGANRNILQGLFLAPQVVSQSVKGAIFASRMFEILEIETLPKYKEKRTDIIQAFKFKDKEKLITFCQSIQKAAPIDSYAIPEPWDMPGYENPVIMAAGAFIQGASIELSADAPIKEPYIGYMQGGLTYSHARLGVIISVQDLLNKKLIKLDKNKENV